MLRGTRQSQQDWCPPAVPTPDVGLIPHGLEHTFCWRAYMTGRQQVTDFTFMLAPSVLANGLARMSYRAWDESSAPVRAVACRAATGLRTACRVGEWRREG